MTPQYEAKHLIKLLALIAATLSIIHYQYSIRPRYLTGSAKSAAEHLDKSLEKYQEFCEKLKKMIHKFNEKGEISQEQKKQVEELLRRTRWFVTYMEGP